jgi:hypothetical protein
MKKKVNDTLTASASPTEEKAFSLIPEETLIALYSNLLKCRLLGERASASVQQRNPKRNLASLRRTAPGIVSVAMDLGPDDSLLSLDGDLAAAFLSGAPLDTLLSLPADSTRGIASRVHEVIGEALVHKTRKDGKVTCAISSQTTSGVWPEALDVARTHGLPMIFVSQLQRPVESRKRIKTDSADEAYLPHIAVDSQDVVAVYRVAHESIARARLGRGPTLIECMPFHVQGQRESPQDAVLKMEDYLSRKGLFNKTMKREIRNAFSLELDAAGI